MSKIQDTIKHACEINPKIVIGTDEEQMETSGFSQDYMDSIGLTKNILKKLERHGLAERAYLPEKTGWRVRWILLAKEGAV